MRPRISFTNILQGVGMAEQALGVIVFRLQIVADIRAQDRRIAQHFLPLLVLQPRIFVDHRDAVRGEGMRPTRRDRRGTCLVF
jgi:hypothetical protein